MKNRRYVKLMLCGLCGLAFVPAPGFAATLLTGDHHITASGGDAGSLELDGELSVGGNGADFGTTGTSSSALALHYAESGSNYILTLSATRAGTAFLWQDNAGGTAASKMKLGADNVLALFAAGYNPSNVDVGKISLNPALGGSGISIDGNAVVTTATYAGVGGILTVDEGDGRYVSNSDITVSEGGPVQDWVTGNWSTGPAIALAGGSATGGYSFAGFSATASGAYSMATGYGSVASEYGAIALGQGSTASGAYSVASGYGSTATGDFSIASGYLSTASGNYSLASGDGSYAFGIGSISTGYGTWSGGFYSIASGVGTGAEGDHSTSSGRWTSALGNGSTSAGYSTTAAGYAQFVIGQSNVPQGNPDEWVPNDALFIIGNGQQFDEAGNEVSNPFTSNALTLLKNANMRTGGVVEAKDGFRTPPKGDLSMGEFTAGRILPIWTRPRASNIQANSSRSGSRKAQKIA